MTKSKSKSKRKSESEKNPEPEVQEQEQGIKQEPEVQENVMEELGVPADAAQPEVQDNQDQGNKTEPEVQAEDKQVEKAPEKVKEVPEKLDGVPKTDETAKSKAEIEIVLSGKNAEQFSTTNADDLKSVAEILKKLDLDASDFTTEQKLNALCLIFKETIAENIRLREANLNMTEQMEKSDQTKTALQNLCQALRTQIELTKEEGQLKLRDETQKRIDVSEKFQKTMDELGGLMATHSETNKKLKEENVLMQKQMQELLKHHQDRQEKFEQLQNESRLKSELFNAKLNKAKLERAEMATDFTKERLELHKSLVEAKDHIDLLLKREENMLEQIELYKLQASEMQNLLQEHGVGSDETGNQNRNFAHFRSEIEKMTKRLRSVEQDTSDWKEKFEASNDQVRKMNAVTMEREKEIEMVKKKLAAMENLNRVLHKERNELLQKVKASEDHKE